MNHPIVIIGGGLAGLSTAIRLARANVPVTLIEKDTYPRQKVCGEYISTEAESFVNLLGIETHTLPHIHQLHLTSASGRMAKIPLQTGGFGISRFSLDHQLAELAKEAGATLITNTRVSKIETEGQTNSIHTIGGEVFKADLVIGSYGKSNPLSGLRIPKGTKQYIGVKYHVHSQAPEEIIEMHVFKGGYCGFSKVEANKYCLCYLGTADDLKAIGGNIEDYEEAILGRNPHLRARFAEVEKITDAVTTSQFYFKAHRGSQLNHLLIGDASGFIPPITGNGMSLAFRSAAWLTPQIIDYFHGKISRNTLFTRQQNYIRRYTTGRIQKGVFLQNLLLKQNAITDGLLFPALQTFPFIGKMLTNQAVGKTIISD
ncbi:MAG: FAD-dependent oxidoreductase [Cryomorphaceae bacterium]|nr:FAD-dependent oxidoreductase [Cryomorphaceae bacterium]